MDDNQIEHYISNGKYQEAFEALNSIQSERKLSENEILKKKYVEIFLCLDNGDFQKGRDIADEMIKLSIKYKNKLGEIDGLIAKVENSYSLLKINECFELIGKAQKLLKLINDKSVNIIKNRKAYLLYLKGKVHRDLHHIIEAIELFKSSYQIRKEINDRFGMLWSLTNLGVIITTIGDFQSADKYLTESLRIAKELDVDVGIVWNLINSGWVKYHLRDLKGAISYANECIELCKSHNFKNVLSHCCDLMGHCCLLKGDLKDALYNFNKSLNIRIELELSLIHI